MSYLHIAGCALCVYCSLIGWKWLVWPMFGGKGYPWQTWEDYQRRMRKYGFNARSRD